MFQPEAFVSSHFPKPWQRRNTCKIINSSFFVVVPPPRRKIRSQAWLLTRSPQFTELLWVTDYLLPLSNVAGVETKYLVRKVKPR